MSHPSIGSVTFRRYEGPVPPASEGLAASEVQRWEFIAPEGHVFAQAEVFPGEDQWGVRLADTAPAISDSDLLRLVGRMLTWEIGCKADTIDVVLGRTHEHHALVRVGGDYV